MSSLPTWSPLSTVQRPQSPAEQRRKYEAAYEELKPSIANAIQPYILNIVESLGIHGLLTIDEVEELTDEFYNFGSESVANSVLKRVTMADNWWVDFCEVLDANQLHKIVFVLRRAAGESEQALRERSSLSNSSTGAQQIAAS